MALRAAWCGVSAVVLVLALAACQRGTAGLGETLGPRSRPAQAYQCGEMRIEARFDYHGCGRFLTP